MDIDIAGMVTKKNNIFKKRVFSGIKPTGSMHLGNYLGAVKNWADSQDEYRNIFCVVDLHAITVKQDSGELKKNIRELSALLLACGIDSQKSDLFIQSHIPAHSEMAWILNCFIPMGWMERMTQFKEKAHLASSGQAEGQKERVSVGLFDYPALMAADILLYDTDIVPVGEDQVQHVELARDIAKRFNGFYGETFVLPGALLQKIGARIMGLLNPDKKMSKSEGGEGNVINILDTPDDIRKKILSAVTDSGKEINFEKSGAGIKNLLTIFQILSGEEPEKIETMFAGKSYVDFKKEIAELVVLKLSPIREKYENLISEPEKLEKIYESGAEKLRPLAEKKLAEVKKKIGLEYWLSLKN